MMIFKSTNSFKTGGFKAAVFLMCAAALVACKAEKSTDTAMLMYDGHAVNPICMMGEADPAGVSLKSCDAKLGVDEYTKPVGGLETLENGMIGYTFECPGGCMRPPFVYYKTVGVLPDGGQVVQVESSGGGTGVFSDVRVVSIDGDMMYQKFITGGDRCNGGLTAAGVEGGQVTYSQNITPYDLVELSGGNEAGFEAYDDISSCAACCVGTAQYKGDALVGITLTADAVDNAAGEGYSPADTCFYGVYNDVVRAGNNILDDADVAEFGAQFNARCGDLKTNRTAGF